MCHVKDAWMGFEWQDILSFSGLCDFSSLVILGERDIPNWKLENSSVLNQKAARNYFLLG